MNHFLVKRKCDDHDRFDRAEQLRHSQQPYGSMQQERALSLRDADLCDRQDRSCMFPQSHWDCWNLLQLQKIVTII